jgi:hypothetical protein
MAHALRYFAEFDSFKSTNCRLEFHLKDYSGDADEVPAAANPVFLRQPASDPMAAIKGQQLEMRLHNVDGALPLETFESDEDDTWLIKFFRAGVLRFIGYLVQDDSDEVQVDWRHEIVLSATDNLGLLKEVPLNEAASRYGTSTTYANQTIGYFSNNIIYAINWTADVQPGDTLILTDGPINGSYLVLTAQPPSVTQHIQVTPTTIPVFPGTATTDVEVIRPVSLKQRMTMAKLLRLCLLSTNLELSTKIYTTLKPDDGPLGRILQDTLLDPGDYKDSRGWDFCYEILEEILKRLRCTLKQNYGEWTITRPHDLRYYDGIIPGYEYDEQMDYVGTAELDELLQVGNGSDIETGLRKSMLRPYKFVRETFDYRTPDNILKNASFEDVGQIITTYPSGLNTVTEYVMPDWNAGGWWTTGGNGYQYSTASRFIRVTRDAVGTEISRVGVVKGHPTYYSLTSAESTPVEVVRGDKIQLSFEFRTNQSEAGWRYFIVNIVTTDPIIPRGVNNKTLTSDGKWEPNPPPPARLIGLYIDPNGDTTSNWHSISVESEELPVDGLLYVKLAQVCADTVIASSETEYRNIRFNVTRSIAGTTTVTGHQHTDTQVNNNINNNQDVKIEIDDSPSNSIAGTLFLPSFTGPLRNRTVSWTRGASAGRLGEISTIDELRWRAAQRTKLSGNLLTSAATPDTLIKYLPEQDKNFIFGNIDVDFKREMTKAELVEIFTDGEPDEIENDYEFKHLYKTT